MPLSDIGSYASIAGLLVTLWILSDLGRIKSRYLFSARVPELARKLRTHSSNLSAMLNDPAANSSQIAEELAAAEVTVTSLSAKVSGVVKKSATSLAKTIRTTQRTGSDVALLRDTYLAMIKLQEELKNLELDLKWER